MQDILDESILRQKVEGALRQKNELLVKVYNRRHVEVNEIVDYFLSFAERLKPMIVDTTQLLNNALDEGKTLLNGGRPGKPSLTLITAPTRLLPLRTRLLGAPVWVRVLVPPAFLA